MSFFKLQPLALYNVGKYSKHVLDALGLFWLADIGYGNLINFPQCLCSVFVLVEEGSLLTLAERYGETI